MKDEALDYATKAMVYVPRKNKETYSSILSDAAFIYYKYGLYDKMITPLKISHNIDKSMLVNTFRNVPKSDIILPKTGLSHRFFSQNRIPESPKT